MVEGATAGDRERTGSLLGAAGALGGSQDSDRNKWPSTLIYV